MKMLTKGIIDSFIKVGRNDIPNAPIVVKYFTPWSNWTWYATAATFTLKDGRDGDAEMFVGQNINPEDIEDVQFFGLVEGLERELGYFHLSELQSVAGPFGLKIERDLHFHNKTLGDVM